MATIKEIAKMAGVSTATVSYVLNDTKKVSPETEKRVREAVKAFDYRPNAIATNLRKGKTTTIGVITEDIRYFPTPEILNGIGEVLEDANYQMVVHDLHLYGKLWPDYNKIDKYKNRIEEGVQLLKQSMVSGIIYVCMHDRVLKSLIEPLNVPLVYAYSYCEGEENFVTYDDYYSAKTMVEHLIELGHKKIGIIGGYEKSYPTQTRLGGIRSALDENDLMIPPEYIKYGDWEFESGYEKAMELLKMGDPPTALFVMNDIMAAGCYHAASELHKKIPTDISIVGFDNRDISKYLIPPLTTMNLPLQEIGKQAFQVLMESMNNENLDPKQVTLPCDIVLRQSTKLT